MFDQQVVNATVFPTEYVAQRQKVNENYPRVSPVDSLSVRGGTRVIVDQAFGEPVRKAITRLIRNTSKISKEDFLPEQFLFQFFAAVNDTRTPVQRKGGDEDPLRYRASILYVSPLAPLIHAGTELISPFYEFTKQVSGKHYAQLDRNRDKIEVSTIGFWSSLALKLDDICLNCAIFRSQGASVAGRQCSFGQERYTSVMKSISLNVSSIGFSDKGEGGKFGIRSNCNCQFDWEVSGSTLKKGVDGGVNELDYYRICYFNQGYCDEYEVECCTIGMKKMVK
ncbi:MAG: hypothetical protein EZS28_025249 [Streblomastix strix]|uniref:Uncharacterized protein n=1 Tax=Streblomastix strix TaxID=222440 RepID=A0A5J4VA60_9EUKA|nr:MAG: hypothetical protein EZS28_025249 [Streblomastix strix]